MLETVKRIIEGDFGYLVHFENLREGLLCGDYFPDVKAGEAPFKTREEAELVGVAYAAATKGRTCNFYIVRSNNFTPVGGWELSNR